MARNNIETVSTNGENLPILQRAGGSGCFFHLLIRMQLMEMIYEVRRAAVPNDMIALNATDEAMLMSERRDTITRLTQRAFRGTVNVILTYLIVRPVRK